MRTKLLLTTTALIMSGFFGYAQNQKLWTLCKTGGSLSGGTMVAINDDASGCAVAHTFDWTYGASPMGNLLYASDGNLYGTCYDGGAFASCVIFRYDPNTDTYTDVWDFDITNGDYPQSGMVEGGNGKLYGAASAGGTTYAGVIYSYDMSTSAYTPEYSFNSATGSQPIGAPIIFGNMMYGLTSSGGTNNGGVIYSYNLSTHIYTVLHHFNGPNDGGVPYGSLLLASDGKFYGMCSGGGAASGGTLFSFEPINNTYMVLHQFVPTTGQTPYASVMEGADGKLYGSTSDGGTNGAGVIFSYDRSTGMYTDVYNFNVTTGEYASSDLTQDGNGMIYGTTGMGGSNGNGTMFRFNPVTHQCTVMMNFDNSTTGSGGNGAVLITPATVGVDQPSQTSSALILFPNPANDVLHISFDANGNSSYVLRNLAGQAVRQWESGMEMQTIDIAELSSGIYFLEATNGDLKEVKKISVE